MARFQRLGSAPPRSAMTIRLCRPALRADGPDAPQRHASSRGQSLVEFALVLPLCLLLLMAVVDFGRMMAMNAAAATASREGARYGVAHGESGSPQYVDCAGIRQAVRGIAG